MLLLIMFDIFIFSSTMSDANQTLKYSHVTKTNPLTQDETELYELSSLAGIVWDPKIFKLVFQSAYKISVICSGTLSKHSFNLETT